MSTNIYRFGSFVLDEAKRELRKNGERVAVPGTVLSALCYLANHRNRAIGRDELARAVFRRANVSDAQLGQIVLQARRAVDDGGHEQKIIHTIARFGFRWVTETVIEECVAESPAAAAASVLGAERGLVRRAIRPWTIGMAGVLASLIAALMVWSHAPPAPASHVIRHAPMVLPAIIDGPKDAIWARLGLMDFVADRLHRGGVEVLPSEATLVLLGSKADPSRLRELAPAGLMIQPHVRLRGRNWQVVLSAADPDGTQRRSEAVDTDLLGAARQASDRLLGALGRMPVGDDEHDVALDERLQRAQAALLANEIETARAILRSAPDAQRNDPEVGLRLAQIDFRAGRLDDAKLALDALLTNERVRRDSAFRSRILNSRAAVWHQLGHPDDAERDLDQAIAGLDSKRDGRQLGEELMARAATRTTLGRYDDALVDFGEARAELLRAGDPLAVARLDANVGRLEYQRGRPALAVDYLAEAGRQFAALGAIGDLLQVLSLRGTANRELLRFDAAWSDSETAWRLRSRARDPALRLTIALNRADVLMDLGRFGDAKAVLDDPDIAAAGGPNEEHRRAYTAIEFAWRTGRADQAVQLADALLAQWPADHWSVRRDWVILRRQQAALLAGVAPLETGIRLGKEQSGIAPPLSAAIVERWRGDVSAADALYRSAMDMAERDGVPADIAEVAQSYAPWLIERGLLAEAARLVGHVSQWSDRDFTCAVLDLQLSRALHRDDLVDAATEKVLRLAGERAVPPAGSVATSVPLLSSR
jgi:DNA-binding winged helix-turn-helix (wHTH) protein/tetratricopeptide (TPR) repeat protein